MNRKFLAAVPLLALGSTAFAQSSVQIYGAVDQAVTHIRGGSSWTGIESGGRSESYLGFRGTEDLGNGLKAQFDLEAGILPDSGSGEQNSFNFKRKATVGLSGNFGSVQLGRDKTAAYRAMEGFDVFSNTGIGGSQLYPRMQTSSTYYWAWSEAYDMDRRKSNQVAYQSPNFHGLQFLASYALGERDSIYYKRGDHTALALRYQQGPWSAALTAEHQKTSSEYSTQSNYYPEPYRMRAYSAGLGYDFGRVKVSGAYRNQHYRKHSNATWSGQSPLGPRIKNHGYQIGIAAPVGAAGVVKASYNHYKQTNAWSEDIRTHHVAVGYEHNLSKRTALYGTYAYMKNRVRNETARSNLYNYSRPSLGGIDMQDTRGRQHGIQLGVRHTF